jgi:flagellar biosynthesis protein FlhF
MQVKKFEAKSMKEALELVKIHLGPEAIILSAKDTHRGFGLLGEKSVEVTAAVSEETLRKKKVAESKLREDLRERYQQIPASKQKEFINKVHHNRYEERREMAMAGSGGSESAVERNRIRNAIPGGPPMPAEERAQLKGLRYADIGDEQYQQQSQQQQYRQQYQQQQQQAQEPVAPMGARGRERVRRAAEAARAASADIFQERHRPPTIMETRKAQAQAQQPQPPGPVAPSRSSDVAALESQVRELKAIVERFQNVPQFPMNTHPGAEQGLPYELSNIYQKLCNQGLQPGYVTNILKTAQREMDADTIRRPAMVDAWAVRHMLNVVEVSPNPLQGRYHVFMGSAGQGKTSSLVKFASHLVLKEKRTIAILSLDNIKVGAAEQLRIFAQILNVPFAIVRGPEEWKVAEQKLGRVQHVLVDAPGLSLQSMEEAEWLKRMLPPAEFNRTLHYVQSATARDEDAIDLASRYQMIGIHDVIFTKLDETARHGVVVNFQQATGAPIHSFGTGTRIPEDYELASKERIVDFIFKLTRFNREEKP